MRLGQEFGNEGMEEVTRILLQSRVRKPGEQLVDLARDIKRLVKSSYPGANHYGIEQFSIQHFLRAIPNSQLQLQMRLKDNINTLNDAVKAAVKLETLNAHYACKKLRATVLQESTDQQVIQEMCDVVIDTVMRRINKITVSAPTQEAPKKKRCFFCNKPGHFKRQCPQIRRSNNYGNYRWMVMQLM